MHPRKHSMYVSAPRFHHCVIYNIPFCATPSRTTNYRDLYQVQIWNCVGLGFLNSAYSILFPLSNKHAMIPSTVPRHPHFTGLHHYEGEAYGPFAFLNPTTRRYPLPYHKKLERNSSEQEDLLKSDSGELQAVKESPKRREVRAKDVYRKWRSRDNRKGTIILLKKFGLYIHGEFHC